MSVDAPKSMFIILVLFSAFHLLKYICPRKTFRSYLSSVLASFVEYKVNVSGCTPESFIPELSRFDCYCVKVSESDICLKQDTIYNYLEQKSVKTSTLQRIQTVLRSFGKYMLFVLRIEDTYVLPHLIHRHGTTFIPYVFTVNEIKQLFKAADHYELKIHNKPTVNLVNCMRCIIKVLYCTGMRRSEVCNLKIEDVDLENCIIYIKHAKNDNKRIVTIVILTNIFLTVEQTLRRDLFLPNVFIRIFVNILN
jgi:site-specific recombinase XerD